jgi:hypothetical protein
MRLLKVTEKYNTHLAAITPEDLWYHQNTEPHPNYDHGVEMDIADFMKWPTNNTKRRVTT